MWKTVDLFRCVFYYQNCAPKSVFVGREAESPFPTEVQELSWMLQRAIRGGLTPWEQVQGQGHPHAENGHDMAFPWLQRGKFKLQKSNSPAISSWQGGEFSVPSFQWATRLVVGHKAGQDCSHSLLDRFFMLWPMGLLQSWSSTLLQRRPL